MKTDNQDKRKERPFFGGRLLSVLFVSYLCVVGLISLLDENETVSVRENRMLKTFPAFSFSALPDGSYLKECEEAYNDTFPARERFIDAADGVRSALTWEGENGVLEAVKENEETEAMSEEEAEALRLAEEARKAEEARRAEEARLAEQAAKEEAERLRLEEAKRWPEFSDEGYEQFVENEQRQYAVLKTPKEDDGAAAGYRVMFVVQKSKAEARSAVDSIRAVQDAFPDSRMIPLLLPSSASFYAEEEYRTGAYSQEEWLEFVYHNLPKGMIKPDVFSALKEHTDEAIYYRSDHHWTQLGAWCIYDLLCDELQLGESVRPEELETTTYGSFVGNLAGQTSSKVFWQQPESSTVWLPKVTIELRIISNRKKFPDVWVEKPVYDDTKSNDYHVFIGGDNPMTVLETDAGTGRTALLFKDSYANCLVPWLAHHYDRITLMDPRHVNTSSANVILAQEYLAGERFDDVYFLQNISDAATAARSVGFSRLLVPEVNMAFRKKVGAA